MRYGGLGLGAYACDVSGEDPPPKAKPRKLCKIVLLRTSSDGYKYQYSHDVRRSQPGFRTMLFREPAFA
ncbi:MAG: hypothetical protein JWM16_6276 [Verrucomicrobiales bacterium]|nr:hypothetical protein [Verrucomicrobiales bacterium]